MNKIIYIIGGVLVIGGLYLILNTNESISNPLRENTIKNNNTSQHKIAYNNQNYEITKVSKTLNEIKEPHKLTETVGTLPKEQDHLVNKDSLQVSQKIENFIADNNLQSIKEIGDVEIFAKNPSQKNEFAPPMPPTLIKLKFKDKSEVIPLDTSLINSNKKIYVVKKDGDKYKEIKEINTEKLTSFTPPSIGQN